MQRIARRLSRVAACALAVGLVGSQAGGESPPDDAVFALLTHKGGFAAGRAHNHLVVAGSPQVEFRFDADEPLATRFRLEALVSELVVDPASWRRELHPRFAALSLLDEPFHEIDDKARGKIRRSMLGGDQLDAERFPRLSVRLVELREDPATVGRVAFGYGGTIEISIHGKTVRRPFHARFERLGERVRLEAVAEAAFRDFGIEPYSAFLGAVKNLDTVHFYLRLSVAPSSEPVPTSS